MIVLKGQIRSLGRWCGFAELISFDHCADAHAIDIALRNFLHRTALARPLINAWAACATSQGGMIENPNFIPTLSPWSLLK